MNDKWNTFLDISVMKEVEYVKSYLDQKVNNY